MAPKNSKNVEFWLKLSATVSTDKYQNIDQGILLIWGGISWKKYFYNIPIKDKINVEY